MSFTNELHDVVHEVEAKVEDFLHHFEGEASEEEKAVLADAKTDATTLHSQIDAEAPEVEADASDALKNAVSDLKSKVADVVEDPSHAVSDVESAGQEFEQQEAPAAEQLEHDAETDASEDAKTVEQEADELVHNVTGAPAAAEPVQPTDEELENPKEGTLAAELKGIRDRQDQEKEDAKNVPEPVEGAETPESFANRFNNAFGNKNDVSGNVHQV